MATFSQDAWRTTKLNLSLKGGLGMVLDPEPIGETAGGPDLCVEFVPFDLGILNLGLSIGILSTGATGTEFDSTHSVVFPLSVMAGKYLSREDWLTFPYFAAAAGLYTKMAIRYEFETTRLIPFEPVEDAVDATAWPTFWDFFRIGPGVMLEAGLLVPVGDIIFLSLAYTVHFFYVDDFFYIRIGGDVGINLNY